MGITLTQYRVTVGLFNSRTVMKDTYSISFGNFIILFCCLSLCVLEFFMSAISDIYQGNKIALLHTPLVIVHFTTMFYLLFSGMPHASSINFTMIINKSVVNAIQSLSLIILLYNFINLYYPLQVICLSSDVNPGPVKT